MVEYTPDQRYRYIGKAPENRQPFSFTNDFLSEKEIEQIKEHCANKLQDSFIARIPGVEMHTAEESKKWINAKNSFLPFDEFEHFYDRLEDHIALLNSFNYRFQIDRLQRLEFMQYTTGSYMRPHVDGRFNNSVKLSCIIALNDQNVDYEGGDLIVYDGNRPVTPAEGAHNIKLKKGTLFTFPGFYVHEVKEITKGTRMSLGCWTYGPNWWS